MEPLVTSDPVSSMQTYVNKHADNLQGPRRSVCGADLVRFIRLLGSTSHFLMVLEVIEGRF